MDIHALIRQFLQQQTIRSLASGAGDDIIKAGVAPFVRRQGVLHYYFMKPLAKNPDTPPPKFQFCKGTRMMKKDGAWVDMREPQNFPSLLAGEGDAQRRVGGDSQSGNTLQSPPHPNLPPQGGKELICESLAQTALREGIEELGLKLQNIKQLFDAGPYGFFSATTGKEKTMRLFAAEMKSEDFSDDIAPTTVERGWLTLAEFDVVGRDDHRYILRDIEKKLGSMDN